MNIPTELLEEMMSTADKMRGAVISHTVQLERNMDVFICNYFCNDHDKATELMELLVSERMEFSKKADTYIQILRKECKQENKDFKKTYPGIATDFQDIAKARNTFAHKLMLMPTQEDVGKHVITFKEFLNETKLIHYTFDDIKAIIDRISKYSLRLRNLNVEEHIQRVEAKKRQQ